VVKPNHLQFQLHQHVNHHVLKNLFHHQHQTKKNNKQVKIPVHQQQQQVKFNLHHHQNVQNVKQHQQLRMLYKQVINQLQPQVKKKGILSLNSI
jgi:hypothetical protein